MFVTVAEKTAKDALIFCWRVNQIAKNVQGVMLRINKMTVNK